MEMNREKAILLILLLIPITASVYYACNMPVSYDEAWTFLNFTQKGFAASATHYPAPNNHVLHSLLTNVTYHFPHFLSFSNLFKLRLPVLIVYLFSLLAGYRFVARHFDKKLALATVAITSVFFLNLYYSYMSRGYALVNLFFILALTESFDIVKLENNTKHWIRFALFSILGFYAMPSFLYPFVTLNIFILYFLYKNVWKQLAANAFVILGVVLLYLPILINDGLSAITDNRYVKPTDWLQTLKTLPYFYPFTLAEISGIHWILLFILAIVSGWILIRSKDKITIVFALVVLSAPLLLMGLQRIVPFARVFCYLGFVFVLLLALPYRQWLYRIKSLYFILGLVFIQGLLVFNFNRKIYAYENKDLAANITAAEIIPKIIGENQYLFNFALLQSNLEFELIDKRHKYHIESVNIPQMSADTISGNDYIIINKDFDRSKMTPMFQTPYYNIYKKNKHRR